MTTKAYVLIDTAVGRTREVMNALSSVSGMETVDAVTGPHDIIAVIVAHDLNSIGQIVTDKVHTIGGVNRTVTCLSVSVG